jgi:hypothetical protein
MKRASINDSQDNETSLRVQRDIEQNRFLRVNLQASSIRPTTNKIHSYES